MPGPYRLIVIGIPVPKGSMKPFMPKGGRFPIVTASNKERLMPWLVAIKDAAMRARGDVASLIDSDPVHVSMQFFLPRPKSLPKRTIACVKKPDVDKLERGILDALTGILFTDDSQVTTIRSEKDYVGAPGDTMHTPHAVITVQVDQKRMAPCLNS